MSDRVWLASARVFYALMRGQKAVHLVGYSVAESKQIAQQVAKHLEALSEPTP